MILDDLFDDDIGRAAGEVVLIRLRVRRLAEEDEVGDVDFPGQRLAGRTAKRAIVVRGGGEGNEGSQTSSGNDAKHEMLPDSADGDIIAMRNRLGQVRTVPHREMAAHFGQS